MLCCERDFELCGIVDGAVLTDECVHHVYVAIQWLRQVFQEVDP